MIQDQKGNLYGIAGGGQGHCFGVTCGVVFKIDTNNVEHVLHTFSFFPDGEEPNSRLLLDQNGTIYGATEFGGDTNCERDGCGTIFKLDAAGNETVLHSFHGGVTDGCYPNDGLTADQLGNLYGTTGYCHRARNKRFFTWPQGQIRRSTYGPTRDCCSFSWSRTFGIRALRRNAASWSRR